LEDGVDDPPALVPGNTGEPLPPGEWVIRLGRPTKEGKPNWDDLRLTDDDRKDDPPRMSVFAERLTSDMNAWVISGKNDIKKNLVMRMNVDEIRSIHSLPIEDFPSAVALDVEWDTLYVQDGDPELKIKDSRVGADGHAGVRHMEKAHQSQYRKKLRVKLLDLVGENYRFIQFEGS
jgi:hypothetical protein